MIRPLRRQHRLTFAILALILVVLFIASLLAKSSMPAKSKLPNALLQSSAGEQR